MGGATDPERVAPARDDQVRSLKAQLAKLGRENAELRAAAESGQGCARMSAFVAVSVAAMLAILFLKVRYFTP